MCFFLFISFPEKRDTISKKSFMTQDCTKTTKISQILHTITMLFIDNGRNFRVKRREKKEIFFREFYFFFFFFLFTISFRFGFGLNFCCAGTNEGYGIPFKLKAVGEMDKWLYYSYPHTFDCFGAFGVRDKKKSSVRPYKIYIYVYNQNKYTQNSKNFG